LRRKQQRMSPRERVLTALNLKKPDRVPWMETYIQSDLVEKILGEKPLTTKDPRVRVPPEILNKLHLDNITYLFRAPEFVEIHEINGARFVGKGLLKTWNDLEKYKEQMPDPNDENFYLPAKEFLREYRKEYAAVASIRAGIASSYLSMGIDGFSLALYDDPQLVEAVIDMFSDFYVQVARNLNELDFDVVVIAEDLGGKTGLLFSPDVIRRYIIPRMARVSENLKIPWIWHSDGNILAILDDMLSLRMSAIANLEPGSVEINEIKEKYGCRVCLMGNIDMYTLSMGTVEETEREVRERIANIGRGGGYILASSNGLASYLKPENILAMNKVLNEYGYY